MELEEWAKVQESLLKAQLKVIRQLLGHGPQKSFRSRGGGKSQMNIVYDILHSAQAPLHIDEILSRAKMDFNLELQRTSVVSAITKKVKSGRMFKRVAPNTFSILESSSGDTS